MLLSKIAKQKVQRTKYKAQSTRFIFPMPDPEIDRRCSICGASVRPRAMFCTQCGQPIANRPKETETSQSDQDPAEDLSENSDTVGTAQRTVPELPETQPLIAVSDLSETQPLIAVPDLSQTQPLTTAHSVAEEMATTRLPNLQRATAVARGLEENVLGRVEKIRKVSSVVIDQAAYDPSVRFLLVAAGFFLLFLFLLILSKVIS